MNKSDSPSVFICHSSKDKKRFVTKFATRLIERGIDAWFDKWEMKIGDSLVKKIFDEGIKNCDKFIIILSKNSINSKWVKKELDVGVVKNIEKETIIMPIIIDDDIEIPIVLSATVWKKIENLKSYDEDFEEIVATILGVSDKPPLGDVPKYALETVLIGGLSKIDSLILRIIIEYLLESNQWSHLLSGLQVKEICNKNDITDEQLTESLEILNNEYYIKITLTSEGYMGSPFQVTDRAIIEYCEHYQKDFDKKVKVIISKIINENIMNSRDLGEASNLNHIIVCSVIKTWESQGLIKFVLHMGGGVLAFQDISAQGKRSFREMLNQ